ncbi:tetratricopeptide repeat protein [uncultured Algibacter sp.]|uniref:tetratricopeptide repeat protein n=1 Tax=uncultured Algibacter sp. TaxID=298659 RepID=UPI002620FD13|nr:tetratricopeptide repeat protein [uncultured Algibacter sp.]
MKKIIFLFLCPFLVFCQTSFDGVESLFENKQYGKAEVFLSEFINKNPDNLKAIELLGDAYGHQKKWDKAIDVYELLVKADDNNANYHYKYGGVLGMKALENKLKAIGFIGDIKYSFEKAAELDKNHIDTRWALVELYMELPSFVGGSMKKSMKYAQELENLSKVDGYLAKGYIYEYDDEPELAEKYYKMAITEGGSLTCYDKLTKLYESENKPKEAIKNIESANKKHQRNALHYQIGKVAAEYNVELHKGEKCLHIYIKNYSAEDGVPKAWAYYRLAQIQTHRKYKAQALKYINLAITELPSIKLFKKQKVEILAL